MKVKQHQEYFLKNGAKVPGVTTISGLVLDNKSQTDRLIDWGIDCYRKGDDWRKVREKAGLIGTITHEKIECFLSDRKFEPEDYPQNELNAADLCFNGFKDWWDSQDMEFVCSEQQLVSEKHRYGGTLDLILRESKKDLLLLDVKTSKWITRSYRLQVSAYEKLWNENKEEKIAKRGIIMLSRDDGSYTFKRFKPLVNEWWEFKKALDIYQLRNGSYWDGKN